MWRTVFNPGATPVPLSDDGRTLGGGEWAPAETTDQVVKDAIDASTLIVVDAELAEGQNPEARAAIALTATYRERAERMSGWDKGHLHQLAVDAGLIPADGSEDPRKSELEAMLVRSDVELTPPTAPKSGGKSAAEKKD